MSEPPAASDVLDQLIGDIRRARGPEEKAEQAEIAVRRSGYLVVALLKAYFEQDSSYLEDYRVSVVVFFTWLDAAGSGGAPSDIEVRAKAALDCWADMQALHAGRAIADAVLELPRGHPWRSEDFARQLLDAAMRDAGKRHDAYGVVRCITALLRYNLTEFADAYSLTRTGLALLESITPITARNFRMAVGQYMGLRGHIHPAAPNKDGALALQTALDVVWPLLGQHFEPSMQNEHLLIAGDLLGRAGRLDEAAECFRTIVAGTHPSEPLWGRASVLEGQYRAELGQYEDSRVVLRAVLPQLLDRYISEADRPSGRSVLAHLAVAPSLYISDAASALGVAEAGCGAWNSAFSALDTAMALDYRHTHRSSGVTARAALTPAEVADVGGVLLPDEALLLLGVDDSTMAMLVVPGDTDEPTLHLFWPGWSHVDWQRLLGLTDPEGWLMSMSGSPGSPTRQAALDALVLSLDASIGAPVADTLRAHGLGHVTVVPHRTIGRVPIWTLPSLDGFAVSIAASPSLFASQPRARAAPASVLAATDPTGDLPGARAEGTAIADHLSANGRFAVEILTGRECTAARLEQLAPTGIFHFAGHGQLDLLGRSPAEDQSGLMVCSEDGASGSLWPGADLTAAPIGGSGLLVLSTCRSGEPWLGVDEIHAFGGLPARALAAGAGAVVATLWPITDLLGTVFADVFYQRLASAAPHVDVAAVLRATTAELANLNVGAVQDRLAHLQDSVADAAERDRLGSYLTSLSSGPSHPFRARAEWGAFFTIGTRMLSFAT